MRILDRYILREQLLSLLAALVFFVSVFIIIDVFEKLDTYLDNRVPIHLVATYYAVSVPGIIIEVLPMAMLLSCWSRWDRSGATTS